MFYRGSDQREYLQFCERADIQDYALITSSIVWHVIFMMHKNGQNLSIQTLPNFRLFCSLAFKN
jgi:hypothetical protein